MSLRVDNAYIINLSLSDFIKKYGDLKKEWAEQKFDIVMEELRSYVISNKIYDEYNEADKNFVIYPSSWSNFIKVMMMVYNTISDDILAYSRQDNLLCSDITYQNIARDCSANLCLFEDSGELIVVLFGSNKFLKLFKECFKNHIIDISIDTRSDADYSDNTDKIIERWLRMTNRGSTSIQDISISEDLTTIPDKFQFRRVLHKYIKEETQN